MSLKNIYLERKKNVCEPPTIQVPKCLLGTMLLPKKEELEAASLNTTESPYITPHVVGADFGNISSAKNISLQEGTWPGKGQDP